MSPFLLSFLVVFTCCGKRQTTQIVDVTKPTTLTLTPAPGQGTSVHSFSLPIRGKIDGSAQFWGTGLQTNHFTGKFEMQHRGDYYATNCVIEYRPVGVRTGQISIEYEFRCVD